LASVVVAVQSRDSSDESLDRTIPALIAAAEQSDRAAIERLFSTLYSELHRLAARELAKGSGVSISATTLLHEAYLDVAKRAGLEFGGREQFLRYASRVMRGLIIDHIRSRHAQKRGGEFHITSFETAMSEAPIENNDLERVSSALDELAEVDRTLAETVDLKFFCGFTFAEIAAMQGISERTVQRNWEKARLYLHRSIQSLPI
jgi:RNA polymerase sigma factor (TIGR02999 family)